MSSWNPSRNPSEFPALFASIAAAAPGTFILGQIGPDLTLAAAKRLQRKWSVFQASLRQHPNHKITASARGKVFRTAFKPVEGVQCLIITVGLSMHYSQVLGNFDEDHVKTD